MPFLLPVTAPCCHKQIRSQLDRHIETSPKSDISGLGPEGNGLTEMLQHGIFRERQSEMVTDSIRALLLKKCGYTTTVFEFIGGEHTAKNVMIAAVKKSQTSEIEVGQNLLKARELLAVLQEKDEANRRRRKKKFQSISVNEFGDVDEDSYTEKHENEEEKHENEEEKEKLLFEVADMVDTNNKIQILKEKDEEEAVTRRVDALMKTFGIKKMKLYDLVYGDENSRKAKKSQNTLESGSKSPDDESENQESGSIVSQEGKTKKQLKLRKLLK